jgi:hypothetical protein
MDKINLLYACGFYNIILIIFHSLFWKVFKWKTLFHKENKANKIIIQIMNFQLIYLFTMMAYIYLFYSNELLNTKIGYIILVTYAGFWMVRFIQQFVFLKMKGRFIISLTFLFLFGTIIHTLPLFL